MTEQRLLRGFGYGLIATLAMSVFMVVGIVSGASPLPKPIPKAVVTQLFGNSMSGPLLMMLATGLHLGYGGIFGAALAWVARPVTIGSGLVLGAGLWIVMQIAFLPLLGWGVFGTAITPKIALATLFLHLIYGGVVGWSLDRDMRMPRNKEIRTPDAGK